MKRQITVNSLKKWNPIFFSKRSVQFHGDIGYKVIRYIGKDILEVKTDRGNVYYEIIDGKEFRYTTLMTVSNLK